MIRLQLLNLVEEYIVVPHGVKISNPNQSISITINARFTRRTFKHFIESRIASGNSRSDIVYLLNRAPEVINNPDLNITNPKNRHLRSRLLGTYFEDTQKAVMVVLDGDNAIKEIISLHFKSRKSFYRLLNIIK